jgi:hypothetical protein
MTAVCSELVFALVLVLVWLLVLVVTVLAEKRGVAGSW